MSEEVSELNGEVHDTYKEKLNIFLGTFPSRLPHETGDNWSEYHRRNTTPSDGLSIPTLLPNEINVSSAPLTGLLNRLARNGITTLGELLVNDVSDFKRLGFRVRSLNRILMLQELAQIRFKEIIANKRNGN